LFLRMVDWHPMVIAGPRSLLAGLLLFAIRLFAPAGKTGRKSAYLGTLLRDAPSLAACGLSYAATMLLFVAANKLTSSANAILLQYAAPVWAALLGWFFLKERPRWENWCALAIVSFGMYLVFSGGLSAGRTAGALLGDILALVSGITFGANSVILRAQKERSPADIMLFAHIICVLVSIPFFFNHPPSMTFKNIICVVYMGIFQLGMASALFAYGIKRVTAVQAMLTATIEPVLNPVWVLLAIGEKPAVSVITGGSVIIAAVVFSSILSTLRRRN
ncbi:MAG: DMT family transporter, partial [Treponema sp.]|nr:DMT family transporter [Treponema sp.]